MAGGSAGIAVSFSGVSDNVYKFGFCILNLLVFSSFVCFIRMSPFSRKYNIKAQFVKCSEAFSPSPGFSKENSKLLRRSETVKPVKHIHCGCRAPQDFCESVHPQVVQRGKKTVFRSVQDKPLQRGFYDNAELFK